MRFRKILCIQTEPNVERGPSPSTSWGACRQTSRFVVGWQLSLAAGADAVMGKRLVGMSKCLLRAWGLILPGSSPAPLGLGAANTALPSSTPPARHTSTPHPAEPPGLLSSLRSPPCSQRFGRICTWSDLPSHSLELICHSSSVTLCCHQQAPDAPRTAASVGTKDRGDQIRSKDQSRAEQLSFISSQTACMQPKCTQHHRACPVQIWW